GIDLRRYSHAGVRKGPPVGGRQFTPSSDVLPHARKPRTQYRRLELVQPAVHAKQLMMIAIGLSTVSKLPDAFGQGRLVGHDCAAVAKRAEIFRRIETEGAGFAERAYGFSVAACEVGLAAVFDEGKPVSCSHRGERIHVGRLSIEVYRQQRSGARGD